MDKLSEIIQKDLTKKLINKWFFPPNGANLDAKIYYVDVSRGEGVSEIQIKAEVYNGDKVIDDIKVSPHDIGSIYQNREMLEEARLNTISKQQKFSSWVLEGYN